MQPASALIWRKSGTLLSLFHSATEGPGKQIPGFTAEEVQAAYDVIMARFVTAGMVGGVEEEGVEVIGFYGNYVIITWHNADMWTSLKRE